MRRSVYVFGDNRFALEIADKLEEDNSVYICTQTQESVDELKKMGYEKVELFDLSDDWQSLFEGKSIESILVFCALDSEEENLFLTISLRAEYEKLVMIGLVRDANSGKKLKLAGANKTLPFIQMTANIITEILEKPYVTNVVHSILYEKSDLKIYQVELSADSVLLGKIIDKYKWFNEHNIKLIALSNEAYGITYIYDKELDDYALKEDDILVVIGYDKDIKMFQDKVGKVREENWNNWRW